MDPKEGMWLGGGGLERQEVKRRKIRHLEALADGDAALGADLVPFQV